jgi:predicted CxxxxCH...CXXCH cytochrome family protein
MYKDAAMRCGAILIVVIASACSGFHVDVPPPNTEADVGCAFACHGAENSNAPPKSVSGAMETTARAVGAHQVHMTPDPVWHLAVTCEDCHVVPMNVGDAGHMDGDNIAELTFSGRAGASAWNGTTCTTGCHGSATWGGARATPTWTLVDGSQAQCGSCHGAPPPAPHPPDANCARCHPTMEDNSLSFRDPASHINGHVDVIDPGQTGGCTGVCHGSTNAAPPKDIAGNEMSAKVGAHQAHLRTSNWHRAIPCASCHVVPLTDDAPGHRDGDNIAEVKFTTLNPAATYTGITCGSLYCHGNGRGNTGTATWTSTTPMQCGSCHSVTGSNMSGQHAKHIGEGVRCNRCHSTVVDVNRNIINANLHVNGVHDVRLTQGNFNPADRTCKNTQCHGNKTW